MQACQLHLDVAISTDKKLLRIHERWLSLKDAVEELGLFGTMAEDKVVIFAVKSLFADVLNQLPPEAFLQSGGISWRSSEWHIKREICRAEERLVSNQEMEVRVTDKENNGSPGICVEWAVNARPQDHNAMIEVQCHRASRCSHLRESLLIASDGTCASSPKAASLHFIASISLLKLLVTS